MPGKSYGLFCPVSKACELLEPRWTIQILCEMAGGNTGSVHGRGVISAPSTV